MTAAPTLAQRPQHATIGVIAVAGVTDLVVLFGWLAGAFLVVATAGTLYLALVGIRDERHRPVGVGEDGAGPTGEEAEGDADE